MKVAYVSQFDPNDPVVAEGTLYQMGRALESARLDVTRIGPLLAEAPLSTRLAKVWSTKVQKASFSSDYHAGLLKVLSGQAEQALADCDPDVIVAADTLPLAYLRSDRPIALWTTATFANKQDIYPSYRGIPESGVQDAHDADRRAMARADAVIFTSQWAADSAIQSYGVPESKVHVVPPGANIEPVMDRADVAAAIAARSEVDCRLVYVSPSWERGQGSLAVDIARMLEQIGVSTTITIIGGEPPDGWPVPDFCTVEGFVDRSTAAGRAHYEELLSQAHFLVVPSASEAFGMVYAEGNCYGLPAIGCRVRGVPDVIRDGVNGMTFAPATKSVEYAEWIKGVFRQPERYQRLAEAAYKAYTTRLNWSTAGAQVRDILDDIS